MSSFSECKNLIFLGEYPRPALLSQTEKAEALEKLLQYLARERGIPSFSASYEKKRALVRAFMNERAPLPVPQEILDVQDSLFWTESVERGIVTLRDLKELEKDICLWQGDIIRLQTDGIVNAANSALLGCFVAGHHCIDNAIHSFAGMQVRADCATLMKAQGSEEKCGRAKITSAYNLPSKYILHTVGPFVRRSVSQTERELLRSCYLSCMDLAEEAGLQSIAFCCISTGVFNYPQEEAAELAVETVREWKQSHAESGLKVVFNTFLPRDTQIYKNIL